MIESPIKIGCGGLSPRIYLLRLGIVLLGEFAEHFADVLLGYFVANPAVCSLVCGCFATIDPAEVSEESFCFGLTVTGLLPHADWVFTVPLGQTLGGECLLDHSERDLYPADNLRGIETAGEASELDGSFSAGHQVVDVEKFVSATSRLESIGILVFLHASAVGTLLPPLGASDGIHSLFKVGGGVDEFRQLLCAPALKPNMAVYSTCGIHSMPLLVEDANDLDELNDTGFASKYRRDDFNSDVSGFIDPDASIALGNPTFRQVGNLYASRVVTADVEFIISGAGCFNFYAEGKFLGDSVGICRVSRCFGHRSGLRRACLGWTLYIRKE